MMMQATATQAFPALGASPQFMASRRLSRSTLVSMLSPSLGEARAKQVVTNAILQLSLPTGRITVDEALRVFERISGTPGLVGVTARFAKAKLILVCGV